MIKTFFIQFGFPWDVVAKNLPVELIQRFQDKVQSSSMFSGIEIYDEELFNDLYLTNKTINGKSLIRLIRKRLSIEKNAIEDNNFYELHLEFLKNNELKLKEDPSSYYDIKTECNQCGRYIWTQKKELEIKSKIKNNITNVENGEIIISSKLKNALVEKNIKNVIFRKVKNLDIWQLESNQTVKIIEKDNEYILPKSVCSKCKKPRILVYENSNKVNLFAPPYNVPRIEETPILLLEKAEGDFAFTNLEFGTIGRTPENSPPTDKDEFTYKTSWPKIVVSGKLCRILFEENIKDLVITPVKILNE